MEKIIAIVVTYNRCKLLTECVSALRNQTRHLDSILIVNNGSTDGTDEWLTQQQNIQYLKQKNCGSAGGFYTGIKWACEHGYDWMWLMDDDGFPKRDGLKKLMEDQRGTLCFRNCAVINKSDKDSFVWKTGKAKGLSMSKQIIVENVAHPFNGSLIHRELVNIVGLPRKELFIWGDETEYLYRVIYRYKLSCYTKLTSVHYHPPGNYSYKNDWNYETNWKMYFYVRNRLAILQAKHRNPFIYFLKYSIFIVAFGTLICLFQRTSKLKKIRFLAHPIKDALNGNYQATPESVLSLLKE